MIAIFRACVLVLMAGLLAACTVEPPLDQNVAKSLRVQKVTVSVADGRTYRGPSPAQMGVSEARLRSDVEAALSRELKAASKSGTRPVIVTVEITEIALHSTLPGLLRPFPYSQMAALVDITDARTGEVILSRQPIRGNDNVGEHSLGSSANVTFSAGKPVWQAYSDTVTGFAADARRQLLQWEGFMTMVN